MRVERASSESEPMTRGSVRWSVRCLSESAIWTRILGIITAKTESS